ncbi:amino acid ABC transporter ATP-binding protein [Paenarthrobacter ureafaciens]|nr:amino acid ABC transporter ATP-binding protein [Paenarthrobacter ureafaciens]RWW95788.1 amino acid ABC transporter ATP-binding protein [Paenarthrobacter ureafaciens]
MPLQSKAFQRWLHNVAPDASTADVCRVSGIKRTTLAQQLVRGKVAESTLVSISRAYGLNPVQELATFDLYAVLHGDPVPPTPAELVSQIATIDLLRAVTMVIVTHELAFARHVADEVIFMDGGVVVERGPAAEVLSSPTQERTKLFVKRLQHDV